MIINNKNKDMNNYISIMNGPDSISASMLFFILLNKNCHHKISLICNLSINQKMNEIKKHL